MFDVLWAAYRRCEAEYFCDNVSEHRRALEMLFHASGYAVGRRNG